jgi:ribosome maturation factor RimP
LFHWNRPMDQPILRIMEECARLKGAHLIDFVQRGDRGRQVFEVYIDTEQGTTSELCADVSREITAALDAAKLATRDYRLEVSSPGIDRPLKFPWQYRKHLGRAITLTVQGARGIEQFSGTFVGMDDRAVRLETDHGREPLVIPIDTILEGRVPAPW